MLNELHQLIASTEQVPREMLLPGALQRYSDAVILSVLLAQPPWGCTGGFLSKHFITFLINPNVTLTAPEEEADTDVL